MKLVGLILFAASLMFMHANGTLLFPGPVPIPHSPCHKQPITPFKCLESDLERYEEKQCLDVGWSNSKDGLACWCVDTNSGLPKVPHIIRKNEFQSCTDLVKSFLQSDTLSVSREQQTGISNNGEYYVMLEDGTLQIVKYEFEGDLYSAIVETVPEV
uniref:Thyroglobulin type-1 domain-containing protein n=1 Tax=Ciona savignyi TaxID=51511 RepID=H2ZJA3_CIOSA